jgi:hypothetical protein
MSTVRLCNGCMAVHPYDAIAKWGFHGVRYVGLREKKDGTIEHVHEMLGERDYDLCAECARVAMLAVRDYVMGKENE